MWFEECTNWRILECKKGLKNARFEECKNWTEESKIWMMHELNNASENWTEDCNYWRMWKLMNERIEELKNVIKEWNDFRFEEYKNWRMQELNWKLRTEECNN